MIAACSLLPPLSGWARTIMARQAAFTSAAGSGGLGFNPRISQASFGVAVLRFRIAAHAAGKEGFFPCFFGLGGVTVLGGRVATALFPVARSIPHCLHHSERFLPM